MTTIGNVILSLLTLVYSGLLFTLFGKLPGGSDSAAGYVWLSVILNLVLLFGFSLVSVIISMEGGFEWISSSGWVRLMVVAVGLFAAIFTTGLCAVFSNEKERMPVMLRYAVPIIPLVIPLLLIISATILLNNGLRGSVPVAFYKWPLTAVFAIGLVGFGYTVYAYDKDSREDYSRRVKSFTEDQNLNRERILLEIDSCDVTKDMVFILVFTDANQHPGVRSRAVEKVKSALGWQQELIRLLKTGWAPEAFNFLASNEVADPGIFPPAINEGILNQAKLIRENIRKSSHSSNFYPGLFSWEVERVLRTANKFENKGVDFLPAIKQLRAALNEPSGFEKPRFDCIDPLDGWIRKHE